MNENKHIGSSLDDFLREEGILEHCDEVGAKYAFFMQVEDLKKQKYHFRILFEKRGFSASCIELDGCFTESRTLNGLKKNMKIALDLYLEEPEDESKKTILENNKTDLQKNITRDRLIPLTRWNEYHDYPTTSGLRHLVFFEEQNGFNMVIRRIGKRVCICEKSFFEWVEKQNSMNKK